MPLGSSPGGAGSGSHPLVPQGHRRAPGAAGQRHPGPERPVHGLQASLRPNGSTFGNSLTSSSTAWRGETRGACRRTERRVLDTAFERVAGHLDSRPRVLNHRDYHSWNLMGSTTTPWWSSTFRTRCWPRPNTISLRCLNDRETDQVVTPAVEEQLIDYYLERTRRMGRAPAGPGRSSGRLTCWPPCNGISRWSGRFRYLDLVKGKPALQTDTSLPTLRRIGRNVRRVPQGWNT